MIQALTFHDIRKIAMWLDWNDCITVVDIRSGRMYERCAINMDETTERVFIYTEDGAYWDYEYGNTWWAYMVIPHQVDIPKWDIE